MRHDSKPLSQASLEPHVRLANGVVLKAVRDLHAKDELVSLDALCFWISDEPCFWLDFIGYEREPEHALLQVLWSGGDANKRE